MEKIKIIGSYITKFGELWDRSLESLFEEAIYGSLVSVDDSLFNPEKIEAVFVANMAGGQYSNQLHLNALVSQMFPHLPPTFRVEAACASGSMAVEAAELALLSGKYKTVLVVGAEKMTDVSSGETTKILSGASEHQKEYGSNFPALYALLAQAHMGKFGTTREQLSAIASKNHKHAVSNPKAQFRREIPTEVISKSMTVASPLRLLDCSPVSDGASAVILTTKNIKKYKNKPEIIGFGHAQDSLNLADRKNLLELSATKKAAQIAYKQAKIKPENISFAEVHDCFTIAEILAIEDLGFFKKGMGGKAVELGKTSYQDKKTLADNVTSLQNSDLTPVVINPSGGLKACGHPVGATGVKQIAFLAQLLEERFVISETTKKSAEKQNQVSQNQKEIAPTYALAHNVGGSGATAIVHIIKSGERFIFKKVQVK